MKKLFLLLALTSSACFAMKKEKTSKICYEPHEEPDAENKWFKLAHNGFVSIEYGQQDEAGIKRGSSIIYRNKACLLNLLMISQYQREKRPITELAISGDKLIGIWRKNIEDLPDIERLTINAPSLQFFDPNIVNSLAKIQSIIFEKHNLSEENLSGLTQIFGKKLITASS